jgi:hypothetical protein
MAYIDLFGRIMSNLSSETDLGVTPSPQFGFSEAITVARCISSTIADRRKECWAIGISNADVHKILSMSSVSSSRTKSGYKSHKNGQSKS